MDTDMGIHAETHMDTDTWPHTDGLRDVHVAGINENPEAAALGTSGRVWPAPTCWWKGTWSWTWGAGTGFEFGGSGWGVYPRAALTHDRAEQRLLKGQAGSRAGGQGLGPRTTSPQSRA